MKKLMIAAAFLCAALASCGGSKNVKSFNEIDSLSYAIGIDLALNTGVRGVADSTLNGNLLAAAFRDTWANKLQMTPEDATAFINEWFSVRQPARQKAESQAWLDEVKASNSNVQTTASGLMYEVVNPGDSSIKATNDADRVVVKYRGTLKDGSEFDSRDSIAFPLNGVISAWTEGMKLVGKGGEIVLWAPSELAYGERQQGSIPANSALKFEVTLLDVIPAAAE